MHTQWLRLALLTFGIGALGNFALCVAYQDRTTGYFAAGCAAGAALTAARLRATVRQ